MIKNRQLISNIFEIASGRAVSAVDGGVLSLLVSIIVAVA